MKFKNIDDLLNFYEKKWYNIQYRQWNLLDEYCIYKENDFIILLEKTFRDFLNCLYTDYEIKRFKKIPQKYDDYFFWDSYYDYLERLENSY
jgi:hypothetical protein